MAGITVEELVNLVSYKLDTASLSRVVRQTERLFKHLDQSLNKMTYSMDMGWAMSMKDMTKASRQATSSIMNDAARAGNAWNKAQPTPKAPGTGGGKGGAGGAGGMGLLGMAGRMLGPLAAGYGVLQIGKFAVQSASDLERMTAQFGVMLQSEDKAKAMVESIQRLAASTPLTSMGVTESVKTLLQFGVAGDKAISTVRMLGDVAGGDQQRLNQLALAYGQTMSAGKLMGQDLLQYINVGFNPIKIMAENLEKFGLKAGTSMGDLKEAMSKGKISADMVTKAFQIATSQGGMFFQNMEKQSKTLGGLWSTLVDNIQLSMVNAMAPIIPLMKDLIAWVGGIDWSPLVKSVHMLAYALTTYAVPALGQLRIAMEWMLEYLPVILALMLRIYGAQIVGYIMKAGIAQNILNGAQQIYLWLLRMSGIEAMRHAGQQVTAGRIVSMSWANMGAAARTAGVAMRTALLSLVSPMNVLLVGMLGIWALYKKAKEETAAKISEEDMQMDTFWIEAYKSTEKVDPLDALYKKRKGLEEEFARTGVLDTKTKGALDAVNARIRSKEASKADYETRYARVFGKKPEEDILSGARSQADMLMQGITNNQKKVEVKQTNNMQIATTVDTKGETPLTPSAVRSIADTAMRSLLNVKLIGVLEAGT